MKTVTISIGLILMFFFSNILNTKPYSGYLITKNGKVFRTLDMGWSWNEIKNVPSVVSSKGRIYEKDNNFLNINASGNCTISIFNILGVEVLKLSLPSSMLPIKIGTIEGVGNLCRGLYLVRYDKNGSSYYELFLRY